MMDKHFNRLPSYRAGYWRARHRWYKFGLRRGLFIGLIVGFLYGICPTILQLIF